MTASILVLGAGELGLAVLRQLSRLAAPQNVSVTVLLRPATLNSPDPAKQQEIIELRALGIELLAGDLANGSEAELATVFADYHTVISCIGFAAGPATQRKLTRAVIAGGVKRYVPWQFGVDYDVIGRGSAQDLWDEQLDVRDLLRSQQGTQWVIVSTGMFTSFLFEPSFGVVDLAQNTVHALGDWDTAVTVTTPEDIGLLTARILFSTPPITNQVVYTAGDTLTYGELADTVDAQLGLTLKRERWSVRYLEAELAAAPEDNLMKYRVAFAQGNGVAWDPAITFNGQQQIAVTSVAQWIEQNLKAPATTR
ncbi:MULTISPECIES: aromatic alcohol reductase [Pseudomonas]|uniref:aromatic alcohol reductase n=1 Tax=Pseudomonas TaxID=286 RepID=UPI000281D320|nr:MULTISPECIES: aromatic alcohol reductase [Pseudomonas]NVZ13508.1 aromatic alcohol reductase [Pseudomonas sp. IPO3775]NWA77487.1 aromatic alcohol reductase [Pseudomonas sp. C8002]NWB59823.1 aromatic alcohol reductase [Pseudomonas sp. F1002]NWB68223.1 aromatic alcohol reductase [Pseudomonas sp. I8001]NWC02917.1 aromatic alcohol reductase [Pseudomonas sp. G1002]